MDVNKNDEREKRRREHERRMEKKSQTSKRRKLNVVGGFFTILLVLLLGRVWYFKTVNGEEYEKKALENQYYQRNIETSINPNRGNIVDRNDQSLAISHTVYKIILDVRNLVEEDQEVQDKTVENLSKHLEMPIDTVRAYLAKDTVTGLPVYDKNYVVIAKKIPRKVKNELLASGVKCVYPEPDTARSYIHNTLAAQVIGFIRGDSKSGLEKQYNSELSGEEGRMFRYYNSANNPVTEEKEPKDGYKIVTTLDTNIQRFAEEAATKAGRHYESQNAAVLVMNPTTGEVLAMAQYPSFNLNDPSNTEFFTNQGMPVDPEAIPVEITPEEELNNLYRVWNNYSISSTFEPGSIYKPIVVAAALEEGLVSRDSEYFCGGHLQVLDRELPCWVEKYNGYGSGHGTENLTQVLANSCNVGMFAIGEKLGREFFYKYQHDFGFGELTGIDLPGESGSAASLLYTLAGLNPVEIATGSMGQGFNSTPIQDIAAFSAVINGGNLMKPYIVSQVMDKNGSIVKENHPTVVRKVISRDTSDQMRRMMHEVVTRQGTGKNAVIDGYAMGGKTGTAQQGEKRPDKKDEYVLTFMAYLTVEDPNIIALAIIDRPKEYNEGSTSTAPMLKEVLLKIINYKAIKPTELTSSAGVSTYIENTTPIKDYVNENFKKVASELNTLGMDFDCIGNGDIIVKQFPLAGSMGDKDTRMYLYLGETEVAQPAEETTETGGTGKTDKTDKTARTVVVEEAPELTIVPDVKNASIETATSILENAGFTVVAQIVEDNATFASESGLEVASQSSFEDSGVRIVFEQMPSGGIKIEAGTEIKLKAR